VLTTHLPAQRVDLLIDLARALMLGIGPADASVLLSCIRAELGMQGLAGAPAAHPIIEAAQEDLEAALIVLRRGLTDNRPMPVRDFGRVEGLVSAAVWGLEQAGRAQG
jgi:hypothetical protein